MLPTPAPAARSAQLSTWPRGCPRGASHAMAAPRARSQGPFGGCDLVRELVEECAKGTLSTAEGPHERPPTPPIVQQRPDRPSRLGSRARRRAVLSSPSGPRAAEPTPSRAELDAVRG